MQIKGSTVLITGGAGFIGSHIIDQLLLKKPKKIIVLDDFSRGTSANIEHATKSGIVEIITADIRKKAQIAPHMKGVDYVYHEAAVRITRCAEDPRIAQEVLVDGSFNLLELAVKNKIKKFIFASSASVYGDPSYLPMDEKHPFNNTTAYGAGKIATEEMLKAFHAMYGLPYIILRNFNVYGPRMDIYGVYTEVLIKWLDKIDKNEAPVIHGTGEQALDFVYVEDVARANIKAVESDIQEGVYNVGTGVATSLKQLLEILLELSHAKLTPVFETSVKRPYVQKRIADITKSKEELGFRANITVREGLQKLIVWRQEQLAKKPKV